MGRSQRVLGGPDYFCLEAVPRNEQGGCKRKKRMFQSKAKKVKASDERKKTKKQYKKSHNIAKGKNPQ